jgi:hypothetical protein
MNIPGFTAEASLDKPRGYYQSAHAFTEAGGNALLPAQWWFYCPDPWSQRCFRSCQAQCTRSCAPFDRWCLVTCNEDCYWQCNCDTP